MCMYLFKLDNVCNLNLKPRQLNSSKWSQDLKKAIHTSKYTRKVQGVVREMIFKQNSMKISRTRYR